jgi:RimJ/RimL family protein N-acetyltransferase
LLAYGSVLQVVLGGLYKPRLYIPSTAPLLPINYLHLPADMSSVKASVPRYLYTERLVLELFDHSIPEHYECLWSMNSPTAHARMGDFGIRTLAEFDAINGATHLAGAYCEGMVPDFDFYYILRMGDEDGPVVREVSIAQRGASVPPGIGWCVLEAYIEKGYATEGAKEFLRYRREDFGLQEIMTWPGAMDRESRRVAQKLGFIEGGTLRSKEEPGIVDVVYILAGTKFPLDKEFTISSVRNYCSSEEPEETFREKEIG